MQQNNWYVYIIEGSDGNFYTGITTDVARRWGEHSGTKGSAKTGAKYFRGRKPKSIVYVEEGHNRSTASKREAAIKKLTKAEKILLLKSSSNTLN
jgi:putative endonuclease